MFSRPFIAGSKESRELDRLAVEKHGLDPLDLMDRAGQASFATLRDRWPTATHIAVLCGKGNNGGDGFVVARLAAENDIYVNCLVAASRAELSDSARQMHDRAVLAGVKPVYSGVSGWTEGLERLPEAAVIVDALLGTGGSGKPQGAISQAIAAAQSPGVPILSLDVPSGLDADTGNAPGKAITPDFTITFGWPKPCFYQGRFGLETESWSVADLGYPQVLGNEPAANKASVATPATVGYLARLRTALSAHKGDRGHVLVVAGTPQMPGAATLACMGALYGGAGRITLLSDPETCSIVASHVPEVTYIHRPATHNLPNCDAAVFGPGLGQDESSRNLLALIWGSWRLPAVIDADALNLVSAGLDLPSGPTILTPHAGEAGRLLGLNPARVRSARVKSAQAISSRFKSVALLKGRYSVVAAARHPWSVIPTGHPGLATGGTGDVLSGLIGALLARGVPAYDAAIGGAMEHGLAGWICSERYGGGAYTASQVARALPLARVRMEELCSRDLQRDCSPWPSPDSDWRSPGSTSRSSF